MVSKFFMKAFKRMYQDGELDKMLNADFDKYLENAEIIQGQRDDIRALKETLDDMVKEGKDIEDIPFMALLMSINSAEVLKDVIIYMISIESEVKNENE